MKVCALLDLLDGIAPLHLAQRWDNVGLIAGDKDAEVSKILVTNDLTAEVVHEASALGANFIVSYHPPFIRGQKTMVAPSPLWLAIRNQMSVYSPHTAWDVVQGGVNDFLADAVGLGSGPQGRSALIDGIGRIGDLPTAQTARELAKQVKGACQRPFALLAPTSSLPLIRRVAVAAGAGDDLLAAALSQGAQLFVTGELRHHHICQGVAQGCAVLCLTHSGSERGSLPRLVSAIQEAVRSTGVQTLTLVLSQADKEPLEVL